MFEYVESFYNRKRRHSALGYLTPYQYKNLLYNKAVATYRKPQVKCSKSNKRVWNIQDTNNYQYANQLSELK